jgi:hypothetical protein
MITVIYLQDYEGNKKGDRVKMLALPFIRLKKQKIVKRIASIIHEKEVKEVEKVVKQPTKRGPKKKKK